MDRNLDLRSDSIREIVYGDDESESEISLSPDEVCDVQEDNVSVGLHPSTSGTVYVQSSNIDSDHVSDEDYAVEEDSRGSENEDSDLDVVQPVWRKWNQTDVKFYRIQLQSWRCK